MFNIIDLLEKLASSKKTGGICSTAKKVMELNDRIKYIKGKEWRDDPLWVAETEQRLLGISLSAKRIDVYNDERITNVCKDFYMLRSNGTITVGVDINDCKEWITKSGPSQGKKRADLIISDVTAKLKCKCWSEVYEKYESFLIPGNSVIIRGERGYGRYQEYLIAKEIIQP